MALIPCVSVPAFAEPGDWKSADYVVDSFVEIALGSEYGSQRRQIRKWQGAIRYALVHHAGDTELHERLVRAQFEHLASLTGLSIHAASASEPPNFRVVMSSEARLREDFRTYLGWNSALGREKFFRETVCLATIATRPRTAEIYAAVAVIPVDRARSRGKLVSCVVEELTQALGLPNDSDNVFPSVFNDRSVDDYLTGLDITLLRLLYDPRIRSGMTETEVRPLARRIAADLSRDGGFDRADREARSSGLSALVP